MEFKQLTERAMQVREKFAQFEEAKTGNSWTRYDMMMGFVGDVGDLAKLTMAQEGKREILEKDEKIAHELADCLWSVLVLSKMYEIDLEVAFIKTMSELEDYLEKQLEE
jgi:NTP pyrophosphatase (non-canonical NTP hydrolase)